MDIEQEPTTSIAEFFMTRQATTTERNANETEDAATAAVNEVTRLDTADEVDDAITYCKTNECDPLTQKLAAAQKIVDVGDSSTASGTEEIVGWIILVIFLAVVGFFGVKIIKERK